MASLIAWCTVDAAGTGVLRVDVVNSMTRRPVGFAVVEIYGPVAERGITAERGNVGFSNLPLGNYDIEVHAQKYIPSVTRGVGVGHQDAHVTIILRPTPAKLYPSNGVYIPPSRPIALVRATPKPTPFDPNRATDATVQSKLSGSLLDSLGSLPGVLLNQGNSSDEVSIGGHSADQTALAINGVPVETSAMSANLGLFSNDLFNAVSVDQGPSADSLGGLVNIQTRGPTLDWMGGAQQRLNSFDGEDTTVAEGGTVGRLGLAFSRAYSAEGSSLDGRRFLDTSGLDYVHNGLASTTGDTLESRYPLSPSDVVTASAVQIDQQTANLCILYTGPLPCGYGPGVASVASLSSMQVNNQFSSGAFSGKLTLFSNSQEDSLVEPSDLNDVSGLGTLRLRSGGIMFSGADDLSPNYKVSLTFATTRLVTTVAGGPPSNGPSLVDPIETVSSFSVSAPLVEGRRYSVSTTLGSQSNGTDHATNAGAMVNYRIDDDDTLIAKQEVGLGALPRDVASETFAPTRLSFNCDAHNALGQGPDEQGPGPKAADTSVSWVHSGASLSLSAAFDHQAITNAPLTAVVDAAALDPGLFSPTFLTDVNAEADTACGTAVPFTFGDIYMSIQGSAPKAIYDSAEFEAKAAIGPNVAATLSYSRISARAYGATGPLFAPVSTLIAGRQLPQTPISSASLAFAANVDRGRVTALGSVHYVSSNNANNLPSYLTIDAGAELAVERGSLTLGVLNLSNRFPGPFATDRGSLPLPTRSGQFLTIAEPLSPRTYTIAYSVPVGHSQLPETMPNREYGTILPFDVAGPSDPLVPDRGSVQCGPEMLPTLSPFLDALRGYIRSIERARSASGYPGIFPSVDYGYLRFIYRANGKSFAVLIARQEKPNMQSLQAYFRLQHEFFACEFSHAGTAAQARDLHLFVSPYDERKSVITLAAFAPEIGLYEMPALIEEGSPTFQPIPPSAPEDPFALSSSSICDDSIRPAAQAFLAAFAAYVNAGFNVKEFSLSDTFRIIRHDTPGGANWLEVESDSDILNEISPCLILHDPTALQLARLTLGGSSRDGLDYAPRIGFYREAP